MQNNAELGITIQKCICDKYRIEPHPNAIKQFESSYNAEYSYNIDKLIDAIFGELGKTPVECLTFAPSKSSKETLSPHNFILSNGASLSIRTNLKGDKIAPRVVGQAGINTFNEHFGSIIGYDIKEKNEIKKAVFNNIHNMMPIFIDYIFISDYTVWVQVTKDNIYEYTIFDKSSIVDINLERESFSFTRDLSMWSESTTLKYRGKSLAEIQIHKNRTFKFRFIMNTLSEMLVELRITTETLGITAEKAICDLFGLKTPPEYQGRYSPTLLNEIKPTIAKAFKNLPKATRSTGAEQGKRGENSKCSYDFVLEGGKSLSVKTNTGKMVCPPEVGQPGASTCYHYFKEYVDSDEMTNDAFKKMVMTRIADIMPIYVTHLFDSDFLLWVFKRGESFDFKIYDSNFARNAIWKKEHFQFTKPRLEEWNESNTVKYSGLSIGEFQVHRNRSCFKFRFNMENFESLVMNHSFSEETSYD